ncbi:predicted protein [Postia placenta Mad-698-R]|nr:predicted protein [Postia placenta Mad-698-R]
MNRENSRTRSQRHRNESRRPLIVAPSTRCGRYNIKSTLRERRTLGLLHPHVLQLHTQSTLSSEAPCLTKGKVIAGVTQQQPGLAYIKPAKSRRTTHACHFKRHDSCGASGGTAISTPDLLDYIKAAGRFAAVENNRTRSQRHRNESRRPLMIHASLIGLCLASLASIFGLRVIESATLGMCRLRNKKYLSYTTEAMPDEAPGTE